MKEYIAREAWQVAKIRKALREADASDFATDEELTALDAKWSSSQGYVAAGCAARS